MDGDLEILVDCSDEPTVTLRGEVDFRNTSRVKQAICGLIEHGRTSINIDLGELVFMDSTGVSALIDGAKAAVPKGGKVKLVAPSPQLIKMLEKSGSSTAFRYDKASRRRRYGECLAFKETRNSVEFEVPGRAEMISYIRSRVADFACSMPFGPDEIEDIKVAVGEASANALQHGANPKWRRVGVKMERRKDGVRVSISDKGRGFSPKKVCAPKAGSLIEGGRGIMFMRALMDEVKFHFSRPGTRVQLTKKLRRAPS